MVGIYIILFYLTIAELQVCGGDEKDLFYGEEQETFYWGDWSVWSECERHCSSKQGMRRKVRVCFRSAQNQHLIQPFAVCDGRVDGLHKEEETCYDEKCDGTGNFIGKWSPWEPWTCTYESGLCGIGTNVRTRFCTKLADSVALDSRMRTAPDNCPEGSDTEEEECFARCPAITRADKYGGWSDWTSWVCTKECAPGVMASRERQCDNPLPLKGYTCPGDAIGKSPCNNTCLKQWGEWLHWSTCTKTCDQALRVRSRDCLGYGKPCEGDQTEKKRCLDQTRHQLCPPVNGKWARWTFWSDDCSVTCGKGVRVRTRECNNPAPAGTGKVCEGKSNETRTCTIDVVCPVDGAWTAWSHIDDCSEECGGGTGYRTRQCTPPKYGGRPCEGETEQFDAPCNTQGCPDATLPPAIAETLREMLEDSHVNLEKSHGDSAQMDCTEPIGVIHEDYPEARIEWRRNGKRMAVDGARVQLDAGKLVFEAVRSSDNGVYTCQAEAGGVSGVILAVFSLAVPPEAADTQAFEAEGLEIPCNGEQLGLLFDGFTTQWYKGDSLIKSYEDVEPEEVNVEHFKNIDERYAGVYKCVVIHEATQRQWVTNIAQVEVLPKRAMHKRLLSLAMSQTKVLKGRGSMMMIAGGVGGVVLVVLLCCCVCVCCCFKDEEDDDEKDKKKDPEAAKPLLGAEGGKKTRPPGPQPPGRGGMKGPPKMPGAGDSRAPQMGARKPVAGASPKKGVAQPPAPGKGAMRPQVPPSGKGAGARPTAGPPTGAKKAVQGAAKKGGSPPKTAAKKTTPKKGGSPPKAAPKTTPKKGGSPPKAAPKTTPKKGGSPPKAAAKKTSPKKTGVEVRPAKKTGSPQKKTAAKA